MTVRELDALFKKHRPVEYAHFERIEKKRSTKRDLHAFLLLEELVAGDREMIASAEHDLIWLGTDVEALAKVITEDQLVELVRCGVRFDGFNKTLAMFV